MQDGTLNLRRPYFNGKVGIKPDTWKRSELKKMMKNPLITKRPMTQHEKIRKIVFGAILMAISIFLGISHFGFIPLPFLPIAGATVFHLPVIIAGILVGPEIGFLCGIIFAFAALFQFPTFPWFALMPARPLIGVMSYYVFISIYRLINKTNISHIKYLFFPAMIAAIAGSLTNSIGTLGLGYFFKVFGKTIEVNKAAIVTSIPVVVMEAILAAIIVPILITPLYDYVTQRGNK